MTARGSATSGRGRRKKADIETNESDIGTSSFCPVDDLDNVFHVSVF